MKKKIFLIIVVILLYCIGCDNHESNNHVSRKKTFWKDNNRVSVEITYLPKGSESYTTIKGSSVIQKVATDNGGEIYSIVVHSNDGNITNKLLDYFYIKDKKIYIVENYNELSKKIDKESMQIVFQQEDLKTKSKHGYIINIKNEIDKVIFSLYADKVETGFFKTIVWNKEKKLQTYKTGYGAERDLLEVKFN